NAQTPPTSAEPVAPPAAPPALQPPASAAPSVAPSAGAPAPAPGAIVPAPAAAPPASPAPGAPQVSPETGAAPGLVPAVVIAKWRSQIYGFGEVDIVHDSTQAFPDLGGWLSTAIPKNYNYAGSRGQTTATARNSRFGVVVNPPEFAGIRSTFTLEG